MTCLKFLTTGRPLINFLFDDLSNGSFLHDAVKGTIATTSLLNGFFVTMDQTFDYGRKSAMDYWDIWDQHPTYGMDTMR